ncbi:MAG: hypothetical protein JNK25_12910 [Phycisphaerae bacterium]|nr:hypothetical protein [Phycisphaerae bacterium]
MSTTLGASAKAIDVLMDKACKALEAAEYFKAEELCERAFAESREHHDFERCARICLPLQEARRQRRQAAIDTNRITTISQLPSPKGDIAEGMYLLTPPLVGIAARDFRARANKQEVPTMILVREPTTRSGKWPIVGVGTGPREPVVVRVQLEPPAAEPTVPWFLSAQEALGDAAIRRAPQDVPADHHVDDLADLLEAVPDHEKLIQELAAACRAAIGSTPSTLPRRRPLDSSPFSF